MHPSFVHTTGSCKVKHGKTEKFRNKNKLGLQDKL